MTRPTHRLLVVDDDPVGRARLSRRLERRGYVVAGAAFGREVVAHLASQPVALVLLNTTMPDMSGIEILQHIRRTPSSAHLPVLMMAESEQSNGVAAALDLGANDCVTKPIDFPLTLARIRSQLSRKDAEELLQASEERYALAARGTNDGLWHWDVTTGAVHYSARWKEIVGCAHVELGTGTDEWFSRVHSEDLVRLRHDLDEHLAGRTPHFECEHRMRHASGTFRWVITRGLAVRDQDGRPQRMAGSQSDITEGKVVDALTGLPNRMLLIDRIERALHHHRLATGGQFAVLFVDLDGFKVVNDSFGHLVGDQVLQVVARRLESSLRVSDVVTRPGQAPVALEHTLARLGGDEFVVLLNDIRSVVDATRVADRIQVVLAAPFDVADRKIFTSASIGIVVGTGAYDNPEDLLRDADTAMYRAKARGKGRSEVFDATMREHVMRRLNLDTALRQGLERHEFLPYYQPIIDLRTGRLSGFEALLRWQHPGRGIVLPADFVPVIEENGLVVPIGRRFFADVCGQLRHWREHVSDTGELPISINFAGQQFMDAELLDSLLEMLDETTIDPGQVVVEITESSAIGNFARSVEMLGRIRDAGIRIVLDDFGTGYSSLACLHELPIAGVKLDGSFLSKENRHPAIVKAIITLARELDLTVTAEGVETAAQRDHLAGLGCDFAQGFLFAPPLDAAAAGVLLRESKVWLPAALA